MSARLKIARLRVETETADGLYGVDIEFKAGMNLIHADNTLGKTTCIQSIIYALGLEGAMGPARAVPLKGALTKHLRRENGSDSLVIKSNVFLEMSNGQGHLATVMRSSVEEKKQLIRVWPNQRIVAGLEKLPSTDYFVRIEGAYKRERGFHQFLAKFVGLELPEVRKYDGSHCPLYLEALFSIYYVEQTRGWGGIQNTLPTYLGIQQLAQRVVEFTLALEAQETIKKRQEYLVIKSELEDEWSNNVDRMEGHATDVAGYIVDIPEKPTNDLDFSRLCEITIPGGDKEFSLPEEIERLTAKLHEAKSEMATVDEKAGPLSAKLAENTEKLSEIDNAASRLLEDLVSTEGYVQSIKMRIANVKENLRKYRDIERLNKIGSEEDFSISSERCPTCGQSVDDSLLPHVHDHEILGIAENIKYLNKQLGVLDSLLSAETARQKKKEALVARARQEMRDLRASIRSIKESLVSAGSTLSREDVRKEFSIEQKLEELQKVSEEVHESKERFQYIASRWAEAQSVLSSLPADGLTSSDRRKIGDLENYFKSMLKDFDYQSTSIEELNISLKSYKPAIEDVDLGSEASASDNIRMIWAYLYALMIMSRSEEYETNHLRILILDEPRQQEAKEVSFQSFIQTAASSGEFDEQVIIATSEKYSELTEAVSDLPVNLVHFDHALISPLDPLD